MFLTDWLNWIDQYPLRAAGVLASVILFAWLYVTAQRIWRRSDETRLDKLQDSLERFGAAEYEIRRRLSKELKDPAVPALQEDTGLVDSLVSCQAAPYGSAELREQIAVCLRRGDSSRLEPILRAMNREAHQLAEEFEGLLEAHEQPGWGRSLIKLIRPALPFVLLTAGVTLGIWLAEDIAGLPVDEFTGYEAFGWTIACLITRTVSGLFSLMMLGQVLLVNRRPASGSGLRNGLALVIAALFIGNAAGPDAAPYVLALQILLFPLGFWNQGRPRKSRPFAGHYELAGIDGAAPSAVSDPADTEQQAGPGAASGNAGGTTQRNETR